MQGDAERTEERDVNQVRATNDQADPSAMAPRSAPILIVLAAMSRATMPCRSQIRIVQANVAGDPPPCGAPDPSADFLDDRHQRVCEQHRPCDREPKLRPGSAVGCDAARIVVRGAGDQAGAGNFERRGLVGPTTGLRRSGSDAGLALSLSNPLSSTTVSSR